MAYHKDDSVLMLAWKDKRNVLMLSTWHNNQAEPVRRVPKNNEEEIIQKLRVICDYNKKHGWHGCCGPIHVINSFIRKSKKLWQKKNLWLSEVATVYVASYCTT